jgi:Protein of unknown function (DUF3160)
MFRHECKLSVGILAFAIAVVAVGWWLANPGTARSQPGKDKAAKANEDSLGYTSHFHQELRKIGQITPQDFARRYPGQAKYLEKFSWDPTTAKFWDEFNSDPNKLPQRRGPRTDYRLNDAELAKFKQNGFVVSERLATGSFAETFYRIYSRDLPVFITSDALLHAWHRSYDGMLEELEETYLATSLDEILSAMAKNVPAAQTEYGDGVMKDSLADADYFLAMARSLLAGKQVPTALNQEERVATTLLAVERQQLHKFQLFGRERQMDFSQFKVRGHYENSDQLKRYFKAMMWCGRIDLRIAGGKDYWGVLSSPRELGSAVILNDLLVRSKQFERWQQFDRLIQTFVGRTDSATFAHLGALLDKAGIKSPADLKTIEQLEALQADILAGKVGLQHIRGDVYTSPFGGQVELPRSFTLLGQKFVLDSWVTAKVVFDDILWDDGNGKPDKVWRRVPSCLDVAFAALGNDQVVPLLVDRMTTGTHKFRDKFNYQHNLAATRSVIDAQQPSAWEENLNMGWLGTLREMSKPTTDSKYPEALRTRAWAMKSLNTQLASWTHLRHDTILYAKQSYTSNASCFYPAGFVEPVPHVWDRMEKMTLRAAELIEKTPFPAGTMTRKPPPGGRGRGEWGGVEEKVDFKTRQKEQVAFLQNFAKQVGTLKTIAGKQLEQKELTAAETKFLKDVVQKDSSSGHTEYNGWYTKLFWKSTTDSGLPDAVVADVHTDTPSPTPIGFDPGCVLHQGVGNVDLMLIAIDNGKDRMVFAGPVLSHYEFEMTGIIRKTDSEWRKDLDAGRLPPRPEWTQGYLVPRAKSN